MTIIDPAAAKSAVPVAAGLRKRSTDWKKILSLREMGVFYALMLLVAVLSAATVYLGRPNYLSLLNVTNVMYQASLIGIMAVAMTVILISGNFDLSVGSVAALSAAVLVGKADALGFWPAVALAMAVAVAAGLVNGAIVEFVGINAFIVTLGTMTALRGVVLLYTDGYALSVGNPDVLAAMRAFEAGRLNVAPALALAGVALLGSGAAVLARLLAARSSPNAAAVGLLAAGLCLLGVSWANGLVIPMPKPVIYMVAFTALVWAVLAFSIVGRRLYAVGGNPEAARLSGINVVRYKLMAFVLCSASAGFAGILFASRLRSINPSGLTGAELTVIAAAILGGTSLFGGAGSVIKTLAGALLLFSLTNGFNILNLGANYQGLVEGVVVVVAAGIYTVGGRQRGRKR